MRVRALAVSILAGVLIAGCGAQGRQGANDAAAQADAVTLVDAQRLPEGAVRLGSGTGDNVEAARDGRTAEVRWRVPGETPSQVYAYVYAHPPAGLNAPYDPHTAPRVPAGLQAMTFGLNAVSGTVTGRMVTIEASPGSRGAEVTVEAETIPVQVRPAALELPTGIGRITLTEVTASGRTRVEDSVSSAARRAAVIHFFDHLEAAQPFTGTCPEMTDDPDVITVSFHSHSGAVLATARYSDLFDGTSGHCDPVELTVAGTAVGALGGGNYVTSLQRLFTTKLGH